MNTKFDPDPPQKWTRKLYDETVLRQLDYKQDEDRRKGSEIETNRDLDKPIEQLACDVHEETHDPNRTDIANLAGAQKRMVSMMARVALAHERSSNWLVRLTVVLGILTIPLCIFTVLLFVWTVRLYHVAHQTDERIRQISEQIAEHQHQSPQPGNQ